MTRPMMMALAVLALLTADAFSQKKKKVKPNVNQSKQYPGVWHSPPVVSQNR